MANIVVAKEAQAYCVAARDPHEFDPIHPDLIKALEGLPMPEILQVFPEAEGQEQLFLSGLISDMTDNQAQTFAIAYGAQRKDPTTFIILTLIGLLIIAGIGRFYNGNMGLGILYLLTGGLCWIGTLIDIFKFKTIVFQANSVKAQQIAMLARASGR